MENTIKYFFTPAGVALIGASSNPSKLSYGVLAHLMKYRNQNNIYPINPGSSEILGLPCFPDITSVPDPVELGVIMLPAPVVPATLEACGQRGLKAVVIISGGFKEVGQAGAELERQCLEIAKKYGMRLVGPNCVGVIDYSSGLNTTFIGDLPDKGSIAFISQSGAVGGAITNFVIGKGIGFSHFVSMGNELDVNETDLIEYFGDDPNVKVISAYIEAIQDGKRFIEVAKKVSRKKPIVVLKVGHSDAGARAASSHTGSLVGSYAAYRTAFRQSGVIEVDTTEDFIYVSHALASQPLPKGKNVAVVTNAGGPAALESDYLAKFGFNLVDLSTKTRQTLREKLAPSAQVENPVDMLGGAMPADYFMAMKAVLNDPEVNIGLPVNVPTEVSAPTAIATSIVEAVKGAEKTVISCMMGEERVRESRLIFHENHIPMVQFPEQVGIILNAMCQYAEYLKSEEKLEFSLLQIDSQGVAGILSSGKEKNLGEAAVRPLLSAYGIPLIPGSEALDAAHATRIAEEMGFPVVMKIVSPDILHKSDAGGIQINVKNRDAVRTAFQSIMDHARAYNPQARLMGVLVEKMAPKGQEVIVGMKRDPQFGPLIMFGMGGIYVELFTDVAFRVIPFDWKQAEMMVRETRAGRLLAGYRGGKPADIGAVVDCIMRLAQLAIDFPQIEEVEINPLLVFEEGEGALALDARAILR